MTKTSTRRQAYVDAFHAMTVDPEDNPDCIPSYRAAAGLRAAWGESFYESHSHSLFHRAFCYAGDVAGRGDVEGSYDVALDVIREWTETAPMPEEPRFSYNSWMSAPSEPTERDARVYFNTQYKLAYPNRRANSKHANEFWKENRDVAIRILREKYNAELDKYNAELARIDAQNQKARADYDAKVALRQQSIDEINEILES